MGSKRAIYYLGGLNKAFKVRDRHHPIRRQILRKIEGLTFLLLKVENFHFFALEASKGPKRSSDQIFTMTYAST